MKAYGRYGPELIAKLEGITDRTAAANLHAMSCACAWESVQIVREAHASQNTSQDLLQ